MPNPVRLIRSYKSLSNRQKAIVREVKRAGLNPVGYHRAPYAGRMTRSSMTVHDPFLDLKRGAKVSKNVKYVARHPQARDTPKQQSHMTKKVRALAKKARYSHKKAPSLLKAFLYP